MGRYKRQSKRNKGLQSEKRRKFNIIERDLLEAYLRYYHHAASRVCFPPSTNLSFSNHNHAEYDPDSDDETIRVSNRQATAFENDSTWIAGHEFPPLVTSLLEQPYLALPATLTTTERRTVYEISVHVGLYHVGAGTKFQNDRRTVVSVHPDGFDHVPNLQEPLDFPISRCKPWFYRNDLATFPTPPRKKGPVTAYNFSQHFLSRSNVRESTRKYRGIIESLMAYSYQCLREDTYDTIETLSNPPSLDMLRTSVKKGYSNEGVILVDTADKMIECSQHLLSFIENSEKNQNGDNDDVNDNDHSQDTLTELAFDVEAYNSSKYKQSTCLIQLCTNLQHEYIIDVLAPGVWDNVSLLAPLFANPSIVKIGHGISGIDVPCLHRDFGIFIVNAFDTLEAACRLKFLKKHLGLAKLIKFYQFGQDGEVGERHAELKAKYQMCDWRERPLKDDQLEYSILDVRYLVPLRRFLLRDILEYDTVPPKLVVDTGADNTESDITVGIKSTVPPRRERCISPSINEDYVSPSVDDFQNDIAGEEERSEPNSDANGNESDVDYRHDSMIRQESIEENLNNEMVEGMLEAQNAQDDSSAFFSAHDDIDGRSQSTLGSKVSELRYNQTLMEVLKNSQQKCLALWTVKTEPPGKNETLLHLKKRAMRFSVSEEQSTTNRARRDKKLWSQEDDRLYKELIEWREDVAKKVGVMPSMMCSLDLLAKVAYRRPISILSLKRLNYFLPKIFCEEDYAHHLEDLFSVVASAGDGTLINADAVVRLYAERQIKSTLGNLKEGSQPEEEASVETASKSIAKSEATDSCAESHPMRDIVLEGEEGEDVSLMDATDATDTTPSAPPSRVLQKVAIAVTMASIVTLVGLNILKRKR